MPHFAVRPHLTTRVPLLLLVALLVLGQASNALARQDATPVGEATPAPNPQIAAELTDLLDLCDSIFGVVILDPDGNDVFAHNPDLPFVSASLYKLVLITQITWWAEKGKLSLDDTVELLPEYFVEQNGQDSYFGWESIGYQAPIDELLYATGSYSSNVSSMALLSLTSIEQLNDFAFQIGLEHTWYWLVAGEPGELYAHAEETAAEGDFARAIAFVDSFAGSGTVNVTTPRDMAIFFRMVSTDTLVSPVVSWRVRQVLTSKVINDRLPALLPSATTVIHKTGNLYGVLHDAGIIVTPEGEMVVAALAQAVTNTDTTFSIEQRIGLFAYGYGGGAPGEPTPAQNAEAVGVDPKRFL